MPFHFQKLSIPGVVLIEPEVFNDSRGFFMEIYKTTDFEKFGINKSFVQVDHSHSRKNVLRGLHYQKNPMAQGKLVGVIHGEIFDVVVDMRVGSSTYGKWLGVTLDDKKKQTLYIPEGFAHGFCVLSETVDVIYHCTQIYDRNYQRGVLWSDPEISVSWPIESPILSDKDKGYPPLNQVDNNFSV